MVTYKSVKEKNMGMSFHEETCKALKWLWEIMGPPSMRFFKSLQDYLLLQTMWVNVLHCLSWVQVMNIPQNCRPAPHLKHRLADMSFLWRWVRRVSPGLLPHQFVTVANEPLEQTFTQERQEPTQSCHHEHDPHHGSPWPAGSLPWSLPGLLDGLWGRAGWWVEEEIGLEKGDKQELTLQTIP